jgi:hypothetical protein
VATVKRVLLLVTLAAVVSAASPDAQAATVHARLCGAKKCEALSASLAKYLGRRNGSFAPAKAPKPAPYYRIVVKEHGEGFVNRTIIWVPSRKLWYDKQYLSPPLAGYWRTDDVKLRPKLERLAHSFKPFPAPKHWSRVLPK